MKPRLTCSRSCSLYFLISTGSFLLRLLSRPCNRLLLKMKFVGKSCLFSPWEFYVVSTSCLVKSDDFLKFYDIIIFVANLLSIAIKASFAVFIVSSNDHNCRFQ